MPIHAGEPYAFGPFQLGLPDGWSAEFDDGVHEIAPPEGEFVMQISGYAKDAPIAMGDLQSMADEQAGGAETTPIDLASGLDGLTFDVDGEEHVTRFWLIRHDTAMIAVTMTCGAGDLAASAIPAQMVVSTIGPSDE